MEGKLHPGNELAVARTVLANERTLLAILRTALGCLLGGAGLFKFFGHPVYEIVGIILMIISAVILFVGLRKYRKIKKLIGALTLRTGRPSRRWSIRIGWLIGRYC